MEEASSGQGGHRMKVGFIGAGSMGGLLVGAFIKTGAMLPEQITVSSRTSSKVAALAQLYPGLLPASSNVDAAKDADLLFLCVKPSDFGSVLTEIAPELLPRQIVVSITSAVKVQHLETMLPCKIAKIIPSVVNTVGAGASLCMWGSRMSPEDRSRLLELFSAISRPVEIREQEVRAAADLSSCGPAFFAYLLGQFVDAAVLTAGMDRAMADKLASEMLLGTARLLTEQGFSILELQAKVSVPGGITAAALEVLRGLTADTFQKVLRVTHDKFAEDLDRVETSLFGSEFPRSP
ncbi:MAG: late competence protein ComER [Cohnella sp.]|nr:late competence protein ComER [Cohnella sp.]